MAYELTVFVVDDDPAMRDSLAWLLKAEGLAVETYETAEAFLGTYHPARAGCLVVDVCLPGMSGLDLQDALRVRGITLPIVVVTAYGESATKVRALKAGALDFIEKPINVELLLGRIQEALATDPG